MEKTVLPPAPLATCQSPPTLPKPHVYLAGTREYILLDLDTEPKLSFAAIGTTDMLYCVGMYTEITATKLFCWHIYGDLMRLMDISRKAFSSLIEDSVVFRKISQYVTEFLQDLLDDCTDWGRKTLILATTYTEANDANMAIVDGILEWAKIDQLGCTKKEWKKEHLKQKSGFFVKEPGKGRGDENVLYIGENGDTTGQMKKWEIDGSISQHDGIPLPIG